MKQNNELSEMENMFMTLADKTRLKLLNLMRGGEVCVYWLTEILGESQPKISRHLAHLRNAQIVSVRREGKWMNYKIEVPTNPKAAQILQNTLDWLELQEEMRADYQKLAETSRAAAAVEEKDFTSESQVYGKTNMTRQPRRELEVFLL